MSLIGFRSKNHPQQTRKGTQRDVDDREVPWELFGSLAERFGGFTVDVAATAENAKCDRFFDLGADGLAQSWTGERVWCNPPYSDIAPWVEKAWKERTAHIIVMLLPNNRCEQGWWQDLVEPYRDRADSPLRTEFLRGRFRFLKPGQSAIRPDERPPFGQVLLIWQAGGVGSWPIGGLL